MPGRNLTREEARERARLVQVESYHVDLDLSGAVTDDTFASVTTIVFDIAEAGAQTFLELVAPRVRQVVVDGAALEPAAVFAESRIMLTSLARGRHEVTVVADCAYTNTGEGMHRAVDAVDGQTYLYTQFEVADAPRVFAAFDQPDLKATFAFTVRAPTGWTVIANSTPAQPVGDVWRFAPTPRMSTYIAAVIAGPFHAVHASFESAERSIPLGIYCRRSLAEHLDADAILETTRLGFAWFHQQFDVAYPFDRYDQIFVPEFNAGAMENAGAVTINDRYVFRSKVTTVDHQQRAATVLHEMAHMWFGDLVTMRWWDDLWLNESFATYMSFACQAEALGSRFPNAWTTFANRTKTRAYRQDQLPSTHPIVSDIRDLGDVFVNFDGITYAKGASVLKQLVAYVGRDEFGQGVRAYIQRHAYHNACLSDLLSCLEQASGRDLTAWSRAWLETAGINVLRPQLEVDADGIITSFAIRQEAIALPAGAAGVATLRPHRLRVGCYELRGDVLERTRTIELDVDGELTVVPALTGHRRPAVILLNDDDLTYAKIRLDGPSLATVIRHLSDFEASLPRALCWAASWDMVRDGELATRDYLELVLSNIAQEPDLGVVSSVQAQVAVALQRYAATDWRERGEARWAEAALDLLRSATPGSDHQMAWVHAFASAARSEAHLMIVNGLLAGTEMIDGLTVDTDLRWTLLRRLASGGWADEAEIAAELSRDTTSAGELHAASARAARPTADAKEQAWAQVIGEGTLTNVMQRATIAGFCQVNEPELLAHYASKYFDIVHDVWNSRSQAIAQQIAVGLYPSSQISQDTLDATDAWLSSVQPSAPLRRIVVEQRDDVARALRARDADAAGDLAPGPHVPGRRP